MIAPKNIGADPQVKRISAKDWLSGTVTAFDDGRTPVDGLKSSGNVYLDQDGTIRPRPSLVRYGPQPTGKILGEIFEFKNVSGLSSTNWLICMQSFGASNSPSASRSPSASISPSASTSTSPSASVSPSPSASPSISPSVSPSASTSISPSASRSPSASTSLSPSASTSPSASRSPSASASLSQSPSASVSPSASISPSASRSPSSSVSPSPSNPPAAYAQIFIAKGEDTTWTACTGKYYDDEAEAHFFQIGSKVVIMNGVDTFSYYDIASGNIIPSVALTTPTAPTLDTNGVGGTGFNITYRITANSTIGETAASNKLTVAVDTDRDFWDPPSNGGTDFVKIAWSAVTNATSYNVYMGVVNNFEFLIARNVNTLYFTDDGSFGQVTQYLYPTTDSTVGLKATRGIAIAGRAYMVGIANNPYAVAIGGDPGSELDFSPANGGYTALVGSGTKDLPIIVKSFRDGKGTPQTVVLCQGTNGKGKRFMLQSNPITFGSDIITSYDVIEDNGQDGTDSPDGVISYKDSLYYPSRDGFKTTGTKPQLQNVLSTDRISNTIQSDMKLLNNASMGGCMGLGFEGRLYWALPVSSTTNNEIWVLDLDRKGAWMKPWSIAANWMLLYNDNTGNTHHLVLSNNVIYTLSYSALTTDDGVAFPTSAHSGQVFFSPDKRMWAQLLQVVIVLLKPQGTMTFQISGRTEDNNLQALGDPTEFTAAVESSVAGWGEVNRKILGWGRNRWSKVNLVPTASNNETQEVIIEVDEEVQWADYALSTTEAGIDYNVSDVIYEYVETGLKDLS